MGRLQWQIWLRVSVVWRGYGCHVQRYHKTDYAGERNVSSPLPRIWPRSILTILPLSFIRFYVVDSNVHFIDREGIEQYMTVSEYPKELEKKMKLLTYFKRYMTEHLVKAGGSTNVEAGDVLSRIPHLHTWFRTTCAVVMHLTNGSVQVCTIAPSHWPLNQLISIQFSAKFLWPHENHFVSAHERRHLHRPGQTIPHI